MSNVDFVIKEVLVDVYKSVLTLKAEDGRRVRLVLDGDCCSESYFENNSIADAKSIIGETLVKIQPVREGSTRKRVENADALGFNQEYVVYHALKITTNKQELVLDWRNESNGYYDGTCIVVGWVVVGKDGELGWDDYMRWTEKVGD
jgi:hypothetical protein